MRATLVVRESMCQWLAERRADVPLAQSAAGSRYLSGKVAQAQAVSSVSQLKCVPNAATVESLYAPLSDMFHVDKSAFIPMLEQAASVATLLRPQRWGKTTFLSMVGAYYDVAHKDRPLITIAGGDTPLAHTFSILRFDLAQAARAAAFSGAEADVRQATQASLNRSVISAVKTFNRAYADAPPFDLSDTADDLLSSVAAWAKAKGAPLYVLVDEYDAMLRTLAIASGPHALSTLAGRHGPLREFFGRFKFLHDAGLLPRAFITGA